MDINTPLKQVDLYNLSTGRPLRGEFASPGEEYGAAFRGKDRPFLYYYAVEDGGIGIREFTRREFRHKALCAAACLFREGVARGDRIVHCFSGNDPYDLIFRLAAAMAGAVPVTINWQADNKERIIFKAKTTGAKLVLYDAGFADRIAQIRPALNNLAFLTSGALDACPPAPEIDLFPAGYEDEKMIIFTSGTTGMPKGVRLSHQSYLANRLTFEDYFRLSPAAPLNLLLVNPLHHANSSALADWGMRRKGAVIHLLQRYSTMFWRILAEARGKRRGIFITSLVPRHFDFLADLFETDAIADKGEFLTKSPPPPFTKGGKGQLLRPKPSLDKKELETALAKTDILIGSAPVGPRVFNSVLRYCGRTPHVRFGSTETCLEVMAIPARMSPRAAQKAFAAGLEHVYGGEKTPGYYIGRAHEPYTKVALVRAVDPDRPGFMVPCESGEPGYFITRGPNVMLGYAGEEEATHKVFREGWYTGLRDMGFALPSRDGGLDHYWMARDSALLIRGGANYAYEQVAADLAQVIKDDFHLTEEQCRIAVVGLRIKSEHEDSCCVTIELSEEASHLAEILQRDFIAAASLRVPKGCRPDHLRFGKIPRSFKGAILFEDLKKEYGELLKESPGDFP